MQENRRQLRHKEGLVEYEIRGTAGNCPPVLLLHGFTEDRQVWEKIVPALAKKFQLILPDLPGSGGSEPNPEIKTLEDFALVLKAICDQEGINRLILIGHSMGGYISLAFAEAFPEHIAGLGLFHSTARPDTPEKKAAREKNQDFIRRHGALPFVRQSLPGLYSPEFTLNNPAEIEKQVSRYANFQPETLVLYLEAMKIRPGREKILASAVGPVLFLLGEEDKVIPPDAELSLVHSPRISYFHILPRTAHMGMVENPNLCISHLDRFLDQFTW